MAKATTSLVLPAVSAPPAAAGESEEASPRNERSIIVNVGEADSDAPAAKQERRVIVRTQTAGDAEDKALLATRRRLMGHERG